MKLLAFACLLLLVCLLRTAAAQPAPTDSLTALIEQAMADGNYQTAEAMAREQLHARRSRLGAHPDTAESLRSLAAALWRLGRFREGEPFARESVAMYETLLGRDSPEVGDSLNILGLILMRQRKHPEAKEAYLGALKILRNAHGDEHESVAAVVSNLGALHSEMHDPVAAEPYRRAALAQARRIHGEEHPTVALTLHNLAVVLAEQGENEEAERYFLEALAMRRRLLDPDHPELANTIGRLGELYRSQRRWEEAVSLLEQSLEIARLRLGPDHPRVAIGHHNLATCYLGLGRYEDAVDTARRSLEIRRHVYGSVHKEIIWSLLTIAGLLIDSHHLAEAEVVLVEASTIEAQLPEKMELVDIYWAKLSLVKGDFAEAERYLSRSMAFLEDRVGTKHTPERRSGYGSTHATIAACRLLLHRDNEAWHSLEASLGRQLSDMLFLAPFDRELRNEVGALRSRIAALDASSGGLDPGLLSELRVELLEKEARLQQDYVAHRTDYPPFKERVYPLERVQASFDDETALVGWLDVQLPTVGAVAWGYVVRNHGPVRWVRLGRAANETGTEIAASRSASQLRKACVGAAAWPQRVGASPRVHELARRVARERFDPLEPFLDGVTTIVVVWPGRMIGLPIESLVDAEGNLLADRFTTSYAISATVFTWLQETVHTARRPRALVIGDPVYVQPEELPESRNEAHAVASLFPDATVLLGSEASESRLHRLLLSGDLGTFTVIHFAAHAKVDSKKPERSALLLSTADLPDPFEAALSGEAIYDGRLTAEEIARQWQMDANLVTLGGCETALGREAQGEGYVGLAHAFLQVGARSLLVSLWKVDDQATAALMSRFYENLMGARNAPLPKAQALREAKAWLRSFQTPSGDRPYAHPAYWAAFVLVGHGGEN